MHSLLPNLLRALITNIMLVLLLCTMATPKYNSIKARASVLQPYPPVAVIEGSATMMQLATCFQLQESIPHSG